MRYRVTYSENYYSTLEIEADSPEEAKELFWEQWENDDDFVEDVFVGREVVHSELDVD